MEIQVKLNITLIIIKASNSFYVDLVKRKKGINYTSYTFLRF